MEIKDLNLEKDYSLLINGEWTKGAGSDRIDVISPANGEHLATITDAVNEDVDRAVEAAQEAFKTWGQTDVKERASILNQLRI